MENTDINTSNGFLLLSKYRGPIMGISALWILFFHAWIPLTENTSNVFAVFIFILERYIKRTGFCGVDIFLLLSGLGLTYAIKKETLPVFYFRRLRRLLPVFLTVAVVRTFIEHWSPAEFFGNVSGYNFYVRDIYSFLWFVTAIITLYLFFPLYYKFFISSKNQYVFTACAVLIWGVLSVALRSIIREDMFAFTNRIPVFVTGILFGYITQNKKQTVFKKSTYIILTVIYAAGVVLAYIYNFTPFSFILPQGNCFLPNYLIAVSFPFLFSGLLDVISNKIPAIGKAVIAVFGFFGTLSLELYCVQDKLMDIIPYFEYFGWPAPVINISFFLVITAASWVLSVLFKNLWEFTDRTAKKKKNGQEESSRG